MANGVVRLILWVLFFGLFVAPAGLPSLLLCVQTLVWFTVTAVFFLPPRMKRSTRSKSLAKVHTSFNHSALQQWQCVFRAWHDRCWLLNNGGREGGCQPFVKT